MSALVDIVMPYLSETMIEGGIQAWLKNEGDRIEVGDDLVEINSDKVTSVYPSDTAGTLIEILAGVDAVVPVGVVIARIQTD